LVLSFTYFGFLFVVLNSLKNIGKSKKRTNEVNEFITIIIPFKNESKNIINNLKSIENLKYDKLKYEVIYVDDNSTDDSFIKLSNEIKSQNIRILKISEINQSGKKKAIKYAIDNCKGEIIFTTDADCIVPENWISKTLELFDNKTAFVSGIVKFKDGMGILKKIQQLEFAGLILVGGGLINAGYPTICSAANLAFRKSVFYEVGGYDDNFHITSGDDELLMQKIAKNKNYEVKFLFDKDAVVVTSPNSSLKDFYYQRVRWASKGLHYNNIWLIIFLIIIYLFFVSFPIQLLLGLFVNKVYILTLLLTFTIKIILERQILQHGKNVLFNGINTFTLLLAEFLHIPYIITAGLMGTFGKFKWKNIKHRR
jgi:cellulose synthase/poly-beta-1,6-N-acetylglucosamine synthase-like glycosyltransferase